jgi:hypothetical protein
MNETFQRKHSQLLHCLYESWKVGKISKDEKVLIKRLVSLNKDIVIELGKTNLSKEKKNYLCNLIRTSTICNSEVITKGNSASDFSFSDKVQKELEYDISFNKSLEELEISKFFKSDVEY